jgi:hypothetical protein
MLPLILLTHCALCFKPEKPVVSDSHSTLEQLPLIKQGNCNINANENEVQFILKEWGAIGY